MIKDFGDGFFIFLFLISRTLPFLRVTGSLKDSSHLISFCPEKLSSEPTMQYLKPQRSKSNGIGGFKSGIDSINMPPCADQQVVTWNGF